MLRRILSQYLQNFNSIKVQLKQWILDHPRCGLFHFNSIKVQLKLKWQAGRTAIFVFQFHKGTIKTRFVSLYPYILYLFQFHKGTIKTFC